MHLSLSFIIKGISIIGSSVLIPVLHGGTWTLTAALISPKASLLALIGLAGGLQWTALLLLLMIAVVSIRILLTRKKFKKDLERFSDLEKDS